MTVADDGARRSPPSLPGYDARKRCALPIRDDERTLIPGYHLLEFLGGGGMGAVYKARQIGLDRLVAVKLLRPGLAEEPEFVNRFLTEARTAGKLRHENIVSALDCGIASGFRFMVMEFVDGEPLDETIRRRGRLPEAEALELARQAAEGLQYAWSHRVIHRDVKPQNVLVTPEGVAKICDLGLCRDIRADVHLTTTGYINCTPTHASPEQARGEKDLDCRTDVYSLGVTLYQMVTGALPFEGQSPGDLLIKHATERPAAPKQKNPALSDAASELILKMLEKDRRNRPATPGEVAAALKAMLSRERPHPAVPPPTARHLKAPLTRRAEVPLPPASRRRLLTGGIAVGSMAVALLGVLFLFGADPEQEPFSVPAPPPPARESAPAEDPAGREALAALERLALSGADPEEILFRCDEARSLLKGSAHEARFQEIETDALERARTSKSIAAFDRFLVEIRQVIAGTSGLERREEIERMLSTSLTMPGARPEEVEKLRRGYLARAAGPAPAAPRVEPRKPAPAPPGANPADEAMAALDRQVRAAVQREDFKEAFDLLEERKKLAPSALLSQIYMRRLEVAIALEKLYRELRDQALSALRGGDTAKVRATRERVAKWAVPGHTGLPDPVSEFDKEVAGVSTAATSGAAPSDTVPSRALHTSLVFKGRMWALAGATLRASERSVTVVRHADVWSSADGRKWEKVPQKGGFPMRHSHGSVVFRDRMWVIGGSGDQGHLADVWSSEDGQSWVREVSSAEFLPRLGHGCVVFKDRIWIVGGNVKGNPYATDVWSSPDGVRWTMAAAKAGFRNGGGQQTCVAFDGRLWRFGDDCWTSEDGASWTKVVGQPKPYRSGDSCAVFKDRIFLTGGWYGFRRYHSDVWSTRDGIRWTQESADAAFPVRASHASLVFNNRLWILFGTDGESRSDVWASADGRTFVRTNP